MRTATGLDHRAENLTFTPGSQHVYGNQDLRAEPFAAVALDLAKLWKW